MTPDFQDSASIFQYSNTQVKHVYDINPKIVGSGALNVGYPLYFQDITMMAAQRFMGPLLTLPPQISQVDFHFIKRLGSGFIVFTVILHDHPFAILKPVGFH